MGRKRLDGFFVGSVIGEGVLFVLLDFFRADEAMMEDVAFAPFAVFGDVGDFLGDDVFGALDGVFYRLHSLFGIDELLGLLWKRKDGFAFLEILGKRIEPFFLGDGCPGLPLGLIGSI